MRRNGLPLSGTRLHLLRHGEALHAAGILPMKWRQRGPLPFRIKGGWVVHNGRPVRERLRMQ